LKLVNSPLFASLFLLAACDQFGIDPYLSGKIARNRPQMTFSKIVVGGSLSLVPGPLVPVKGPPNPSKATCLQFLETYDGLLYECHYKSANGLTYLTDGAVVTGVALHPVNGIWYRELPFGLKIQRRLPFGLKVGNNLPEIQERLAKAGIEAEEGPYERDKGLGVFWQLNPGVSIIEDSYAAIELNQSGRVVEILVTPWDGD
jgi:hypothetical protein